MHVLHILASGALGGGFRHLLTLLPALRDCGVDSSAWVGSDGPLATSLRALGFNVHALQLWPLRRYLLHNNQTVDLLHCHGTRAAAMATLLWPRPKSLYTAHGLALRVCSHSWWHRWARQLGESLACRHDGVISVSASDLTLLQQRQMITKPSFVVGNAVIPPKTPLSCRQARAQLHLPQATPKVLLGSIARLVPQKGIDLLADALQWLPAHVQAIVIGEGSEQRKLQNHPAVRRQQMQLMGAYPEASTLLAAFDLFVLPSRWEGEPIALLEAFAAGLPCVATATAGVVDLALASNAVFLVPMNDSRALAAGIQILLTSKSLRHALATRGRIFAKQRTAAAQAQATVAIYRQLLGQ